MPYMIECERDGILPEEFLNADDASDWLDAQEAEKVAEYAEMLLNVYKAFMWPQYPDAEIYPYMHAINAAKDEAEEAINCARQYYLESRMIRYYSYDELTPRR